MAPRNDDAAALDVRGQLRGVEEVAREYRDFPLYRAPQHLLNSFGMTLPMLLLASTFGAPAAGYYAITQTVMGLPSMLIGKSVGDVFYPRVTESIREGRRADREIVKATLALMAAGAIPFGVVERDRHPVWLRVGAGDVPENLRWDPRQVSDILDICGVAS